MTVISAWTDPSPGGSLDLTAGTIVTEAYTDAIASNFLWLAGSTGKVTNWNYATSNATFTTTANTGTAIHAPLVTLTTSGTGEVLVWVGASVSNTTSLALCNLYICQDAVVSGPYALGANPSAGGSVSLVACAVFGPAAGSHQYQPGWATNTGTLSTSGAVLNWVLAVELRR
jgi:hypothetical protein